MYSRLHGCKINGLIRYFIDQEDEHVNIVADGTGRPIFAFLFFLLLQIAARCTTFEGNLRWHININATTDTLWRKSYKILSLHALYDCDTVNCCIRYCQYTLDCDTVNCCIGYCHYTLSRIVIQSTVQQSNDLKSN